jgi:hypothetical protein
MVTFVPGSCGTIMECETKRAMAEGSLHIRSTQKRDISTLTPSEFNDFL